MVGIPFLVYAPPLPYPGYTTIPHTLLCSTVMQQQAPRCTEERPWGSRRRNTMGRRPPCASSLSSCYRCYRSLRRVTPLFPERTEERLDRRRVYLLYTLREEHVAHSGAFLLPSLMLSNDAQGGPLSSLSLGYTRGNPQFLIKVNN